MKKFSFFVLFLFLIFACEKNAIVPKRVDDKERAKLDNSDAGPNSKTSKNSDSNAGDATRPQVKKIEVDILQVGLVKLQNRKIHARALPDDAVNATLTYTSLDTNIATVSKEGMIEAKEVGNTSIIIKSANGVEATVLVEVTAIPIPVEDIEIPSNLDGSILRIGDERSLGVTVRPPNATNPVIRYETNNCAKISVSETGWISALEAGEVSVTVTVQSNPTISKTVHFTIKHKPEIKLESKKIEINAEDEHPAFNVKTLYEKSEYEVKVVGANAQWLSVERIDRDSYPEKDIVTLKAGKNKTVWDRQAYVEITKNGEKLEPIEIIQKKNEHPVIELVWVYGIGEPNPVEKSKIDVVNGEKKFYWEDDKIFHWNETLTTKWFNNRKLHPLNVLANGYSDSAQCWAKTASNMLHWWFEQNKGNIDRYIEKNAITGEEKDKYQCFYRRDFTDAQERDKSFIARHFRTKAHNNKNGDYIENGIAWYLYGRDRISTDGQYKGPALFKDVFGLDRSPVEVNIIQDDKSLFNNSILNALSANKAVGLVIYGSKGKADYKHAITLWGAARDEEGNIVAIYVVDNNFSYNRIFPYGIYYKDGKPYLFNYGVNEFVQNRYVGEVVTLDIGGEYFDRYFQ